MNFSAVCNLIAVDVAIVLRFAAPLWAIREGFLIWMDSRCRIVSRFFWQLVVVFMYLWCCCCWMLLGFFQPIWVIYARRGFVSRTAGILAGFIRSCWRLLLNRAGGISDRIWFCLASFLCIDIFFFSDSRHSLRILWCDPLLLKHFYF